MSIKVSQNCIFYEFPNKLIYQRGGGGGKQHYAIDPIRTHAELLLNIKTPHW